MQTYCKIIHSLQSRQFVSQYQVCQQLLLKESYLYQTPIINNNFGDAKYRWSCMEERMCNHPSNGLEEACTSEQLICHRNFVVIFPFEHKSWGLIPTIQWEAIDKHLQYQAEEFAQGATAN